MGGGSCLLHLVIAMDHDHNANGASGQPITQLPDQLLGLVHSFVLNLEHAAEVLPPPLARATLHQQPDRIL